MRSEIEKSKKRNYFAFLRNFYFRRATRRKFEMLLILGFLGLDIIVGQIYLVDLAEDAAAGLVGVPDAG